MMIEQEERRGKKILFSENDSKDDGGSGKRKEGEKAGLVDRVWI